MSRKATVLFLGMAVILLFIVNTTQAGDCDLHKGWEIGGLNPLIRDTEFGKVKGFIDGSGALAWRGIPFAKPPVKDLRWRAPQDPEPWEGVLKTQEFSFPCTQLGSMFGYPNTETFDLAIGSEDCLYLNIWRPPTSRKNLPVFVWIHGGGNKRSYAGERMYDCANLALSTNSVVVSIQYRMGVLGWFTHPALRTGDPLEDSGNYGTLDIIKALEFVGRNIGEFGGDPSNITVIGQSAGGANIVSLLASPLAEGLFHKAIIMSGGLLTSSVQRGETHAEALLCALLSKDGYATTPEQAREFAAGEGNDWVVSYLKAKSSYEIISEAEKIPPKATPILTDGHVIPSNPLLAFLAGNYIRVPLIIGNTSEEFTLFLQPSYKFDQKGFFELIMGFDPENPELELADVVQADYLPHFSTIVSLGSRLIEASLVDPLAGVISNFQNVYVYRFSWNEQPEPMDVIFGATHGIDIPFLFDYWDQSIYSCGWSEENGHGRIRLSEAMIKYFASFARTGDPNAKGLSVKWEEWSNDESGPTRLIFDAESETLLVGMSSEKYDRNALLQQLAGSHPVVQFVVNAVLAGF